MQILSVPVNELIDKTAAELKKMKELQPPSWATFAKTGMHKERPPVSKDWWYFRAAAILRKVMLRGPVGVAKLRVLYGGTKNRGMKPDKFKAGSGSVARKVLQQLENAKLIKKVAEESKRKGRVISPKGHQLLDKVAASLGK